MGRKTTGGTVADQVIMDDGTENTIADHLREGHRKGTRGLNDEYLSGLHRTLHQAKREPAPEHRHPDPQEEEQEQADSTARPAKKAKRDKRK
jgi:hypothetical protein